MNISADHPEIFRLLGFNRNRLISPLKQVAMQTMPSIETQGISALKPLHACHQIWLRRFHQHVVVIGHQHVAVNTDPCPRAHLCQCLQQHSPVIIPIKDSLAMIAATHYMIHGLIIFNPHTSWHGSTLFCSPLTMQALFARMCGLTPFPCTFPAVLNVLAFTS